MSYTILIAEDDIDIIRVLKLYLENENYRVLSAENGLDAWEILQREKVDLGIFDIMMPKMDGYELIRKVRQYYNIPILVLSAKREDSDKILGLDLGADDYLVKPFNPLEVMARVRSALRRFYHFNSGSTSETEETELTYDDLRVDLHAMKLYKDGTEINVTPTELKILIFFMENPGRVFTKLQISEHLNGMSFESDENTITVHISNLREKLEEDSRNPRYLITVRGLGYKLGESPRRR